MALVFKDRAMETTSIVGTGTATLLGAVTGYQALSAVGDGSLVDYTIEAVDSNGIPTGAWEVGQGTYTLSGTTLSRTTIYASSNGGSAVSFATGTKRVFCTLPENRVTQIAYLDTVNTFAPTARTSGSASWLTFQAPADTNLTASTESIGVLFAGATRQWATGALTTQRAYVLQAPTYAFVGASTLTTAATLAITGAPIQGTNATITNSYALWVQGGNSLFAAPVFGQGTSETVAAFAPSAAAGSGYGLTYSANGGPAVITNGVVRWCVTGAAEYHTFPQIFGSTIGFTSSTFGANNDLTLTRLGIGNLGISSSVRTTGSPSVLTVTTPADTTLTASVESISVNFNCSATRQFSTGALATQRECVIQAPTYGAVGGSTFTDVATLAVTGAPKAGTNITNTNAHGILIQAGAVTAAGSAYGLTCNAPTGGTANFAAQFIGGTVKISEGLSTSFAKVGGSIFDHFADASTTHTDGTEDDLYTDTTPASALGTNGDKFEADYIGTIVSSATATRQIRAYFGGTKILDSGSLTFASGGNYDVWITVIRESSTVVRCKAEFVPSGITLQPVVTYTRITGLTLSSTNILKITGIAAGTGAAAADIVANLGSVKWFPAA